jgi:flagellar assembly protein FliH
MMTLQSEPLNKNAASPVRLFERDPQAAKEISRLKFNPTTQLKEDVTLIVEPVSESTELELRLKNEMAALDVRLNSQAEQMSLQIEAAKIESRSEVRQELEEELERKLVSERERVSGICEQFSRERSKYFKDIEAEVVKLALAIAARVLHREAKLDPLLLAAAVRVALEKLADDSATTLRVPTEELIRWQDFFAAESSVQVVGDGRLAVGDCVLETSVGKVELGVSVQLGEIEKGFFDLLQQRPA